MCSSVTLAATGLRFSRAASNRIEEERLGAGFGSGIVGAASDGLAGGLVVAGSPPTVLGPAGDRFAPTPGGRPRIGPGPVNLASSMDFGAGVSTGGCDRDGGAGGRVGAVATGA